MRRRPATILATAVLVAGAALADENPRDAWRADTRGVLPRLDAAPTIDGTVGAEEWSGALATDGVIYPISVTLFPRRVEWSMGWTADGLHVACRTPRLKGEEPAANAQESDFDALRKDDSFELIVYRDDGKATLRAIVSPAGVSAVRAGGDHSETAAVKTAASLTDTHTDYEMYVPFAALGVDAAAAGDRWRILPVRHLRTGTNVEGPMPYNHRGGLGGRDRAPLFTLGNDRCAVRLQAMQSSLYAGTPVARLTVMNPSDEQRTITARVRITRDGEPIGAASREMTLPPAERLPVTLATRPDPPVNPEAEHEYRCDVDVIAEGGAELFHTHFIWNPATNREWLGDELPKRQRARERVITVDPSKDVPFQFRRFMRLFEDMPEGHKLEITAVRTVVPGKGYVVDSVQHITSIDPSGRKDGVQAFYRTGYLLEHVIHWRKDVKHGPEKFYASGLNREGRRHRYVQKVIPWVDGEVRGVQRVYHATGEVLAETRYEDGKAAGVSKRYDREGRLVRTTPFEDGYKHGTMEEYYPRRPKRTIPVRNGLIHGVVKEYDWEGRLVCKTPYREGLRHGVEEVRPDMSRPLEWEKVHWREGEKVSRERWELTTRPAGDGGRQEAASPDEPGTRDAEQPRTGPSPETVDGVDDGEKIEYWPRRLKRSAPYSRGKVDGEVRDCWENGQLKMSRPFDSDLMHGVEKHYDRDGELTQTRYWWKGDMVSAAEYRARLSEQ